jgi:multiple sugar transport system ATP-binding protein
MAEVHFSGVSKVFPNGCVAVERFDLDVADGEFVVLVGPSGSGKTTVLRITAGLEELSDGEVSIGGNVVNGVHPMDRDIAMVFQNYALYPHMTVAENMGFGLKLRRTSKREIRERVTRTAGVLGLTELLKRRPAQLSGGQRQRVAMGRAIVREPAAFLMDEPLSNLDAKLRVQMRAAIQKLQHRLGTTTLYVTHDQVEAMTMGDRVAVMRKGELQQVAPPQELYDRPVNLFVGGFIGSPAMNLLEAKLQRRNGDLVAVAGSQEVLLTEETTSARPALQQFEGRDVILGIRPEDLEDASLAGDESGDQRLRGEVTLTEALGAEIMVHFRVDAPAAVTEDVRELARDAGAEGLADLGSDEGATMVGRFGARSRVKLGQPVDVAVDTRSLHFFEPESGLGIYDRPEPERTEAR